MFAVSNKKSHDIVLIGEILVDIISSKKGDIESYGGSPANITFNLSRMGFNPFLLATYGTDKYGELISNFIHKENLNPTFINRFNGRTSTVFINQSSGTPLPSFNRQADYHITLSEEAKQTIQSSKLLHFSYWMLTEDHSLKVINEAIDIARKNDVVIGFDPNYHKDIQPEYDVSKMIDIMKKVDIIKPSLDDSKRIFNKDLTPREFLQIYHDLGIPFVVLTMGADGVLVQYRNEIIELPSLATEVVDATGAGDALWSGLYAGLLKGLSLHETIKLGLLCSAHNLKHVGNSEGLPVIEDLLKQL